MPVATELSMPQLIALFGVNVPGRELLIVGLIVAVVCIAVAVAWFMRSGRE